MYFSIAGQIDEVWRSFSWYIKVHVYNVGYTIDVISLFAKLCQFALRKISSAATLMG